MYSAVFYKYLCLLVVSPETHFGELDLTQFHLCVHRRNFLVICLQPTSLNQFLSYLVDVCIYEKNLAQKKC